MALIDFQKLDTRKAEEHGTVIILNGLHFVCKTKKLNDVRSALQENDFVHWVSNGDWSMHELLLMCLELSGPAQVYISSYAFSEKPARLIADLKQRGVIQKLHCLIDSRIDVRSAGAFQLIQNCADSFKLINTHAKVTIIENEDKSFCIVGSANYTTNERYEAGYVSTIRELSQFNKQWIIHAIQQN